MKLSPEQLSHHLNTQPSAVYIIASDEPLLASETMLQLRRHFYAADFREQLTLTPATENNWENLEEQLNQGLLFAENLLIELRLPDNKCPEKMATLLAEFAQNPHPARIILIMLGKLDSATQKTKWFSKIEQHSIFIPLWPPRAHEYPQWLRTRCQQHGVSISNEELQSLAHYTEGNLVSAAQMIEKLKLLPQETGKNRVAETLSDNSHFDLFDLNDALLQANSQRALHILMRFKTQHDEPILILWAITRQVRELLQFQQQLEAGVSLNDLLQKFRVLPSRRNLMSQALRTPKPDIWEQSLSYAHLIDKMIKGLHPGDVWLALEELCLLLTQIKVSLLSLQNSMLE
jgi:DNA polymerase-3 subunit delta